MRSLLRNMEKDRWQSLWERCHGSVYQSWDWAESNKVSGKEPIFLTIEENCELKAGILCFPVKIKTPFGIKTILFAEGTPLFLEKSAGEKILEVFRTEASRYFYGTIAPTAIDQREDIFSSYKKVCNNTLIVDLQKPEEELWKNLEKKSARWGVKTAQGNRLQFEECKSQIELKEFYEIYEKKVLKEGFGLKTLRFLKILLNSNLVKLFLVKKDNRIIAGGIILLDWDYSILSLTAANEEGYKSQAMSFLYWNLILFSKKADKKYFDMGGYDIEAKIGDKMYSINKYKENFGGFIKEQSIYATNWTYPFVRLLMKKMRFIKKLYKK